MSDLPESPRTHQDTSSETYGETVLMSCSFEDCERPVYAKGLCRSHYNKQLTPPDHGPCSFEDCERPIEAKGLCQAHYRQSRRGEALRPVVERAPRGSGRGVCTFPDCGRPLLSRGLCPGHAAQRNKGQDLKPLRAQRTPSSMTRDLPCEFLDCDRTQYSKGLCKTHYNQQLRGAELTPLRQRTKHNPND